MLFKHSFVMLWTIIEYFIPEYYIDDTLWLKLYYLQRSFQNCVLMPATLFYRVHKLELFLYVQ